tara:strand:- start:1110 stop:1232 length:123 start_codon:yes stop_codon:yes gene_type:complete
MERYLADWLEIGNVKAPTLAEQHLLDDYEARISTQEKAET